MTDYLPPSQGVVLEDGLLRVLDPAVAKRLDRKTWSPSAVSTYTQCPTKWAFGAAYPEEDGAFDDAPLGTSGHRVLELLYQLPPEERTRDKAAELIAGLTAESDDVVLPDGGKVEDRIRWQVAVLDRIGGLWALEDPTVVRVEQTEETIESMVGTVPFRGKIDRVETVLGENGDQVGIGIADYKTGKATPPYQRNGTQDDKADSMLAYWVAYQHAKGVTPVRLDLLFTNGKKPDRYVVPTNDARVKKVVAKWESTWKDMKERAQTREYPMKVSALCGWCPLATVCPAADAAGKGVARIPSGNRGLMLGIPTVRPSEEEKAAAVTTPLAPEFVEPETPVPATVSEAPDFPTPPWPNEPNEPHPAVLAPTASVAEPLRSETAPEQKGQNMTVSKWSRASIPAYTETDPSDGSLNPASYAASKAVDMAGDADYYLRSAGQVVTPDRKEAVANLVCELVFAVQQEQFGTTSLQSGTAYLSYRAVKSAVAVSPIPFTNPDAAAWAEWQRWIVAVASASIETGYSLWAYGPRPGAGAFLASLAAAQTTGNPAANYNVA